MSSKLDDVAEATNASSQITTDALARLETQLAVGREDILDSPDLKSLASSMISSMSRIENLLLAQSPGAGTAASSAGHSSAESRRASVPRSPAGSIGHHSTAGSQYGGSNASSGRNRRSSRAGPSDPRGPKVLYSAVGELRLVRYLHESVRPPYETVGLLHEEEERDTYPLFETYSKLLDTASEIVPDCLLRYINLVQFSRTISLHAKLLVTTLAFMQGLEEDNHRYDHETLNKADIDLSSHQDAKVRREYQDVCSQIETLEQNIALVRQECWNNGFNLSEIDMILGGTKSPARNPTIDEPAPTADEHFKALRQRLLHLQSQAAWTNKQDQINTWLLQTLAASSEAAALHRTFLPDGGRNLDEKAWARQVLKFWPLDSAAARVKRRDLKERGSSSICGVKDGRVAHSVRVLLELVDWANSVTTGSEIGDASGNALRGLLEAERPRSPLGEHALNG